MWLRYCLPVIISMTLLSGALVSCASSEGRSIPLASFRENYVSVSISLIQDANEGYVLSATFTPPDGYHLHSKDIPLMGVDGLGRPTLMELVPNSLMETDGSLMESVEPRALDFEPVQLLVYPAGAVTLRLPVRLPAGDRWVDDAVSVTYMACSASECKPPVMGKIVPVRVPGADVPDDR